MLGTIVTITNERLKVFLCHSSADKPSVRKIYRRLKKDGFAPWLDEKDLLPGQDWDREIRQAVRLSHAVVVCLSRRSLTKEGYVQKEIRHSLDIAQEKPPGTIFLIPLRVEECAVPEPLNGWQWVDLFRTDGYNRLVTALRSRANSLNLHQPPEPPRPRPNKPQSKRSAPIARSSITSDPALNELQAEILFVIWQRWHQGSEPPTAEQIATAFAGRNIQVTVASVRTEILNLSRRSNAILTDTLKRTHGKAGAAISAFTFRSDTITSPGTARIALELAEQPGSKMHIEAFVERIQALNIVSSMTGVPLTNTAIEIEISFCIETGYCDQIADFLRATNRIKSEAPFLKRIADSGDRSYAERR